MENELDNQESLEKSPKRKEPTSSKASEGFGSTAKVAVEAPKKPEPPAPKKPAPAPKPTPKPAPAPKPVPATTPDEDKDEFVLPEAAKWFTIIVRSSSFSFVFYNLLKSIYADRYKNIQQATEAANGFENKPCKEDMEII
jgi:hypothetical protein